jgi:hypothetical protein
MAVGEQWRGAGREAVVVGLACRTRSRAMDGGMDGGWRMEDGGWRQGGLRLRAVSGSSSARHKGGETRG